MPYNQYPLAGQAQGLANLGRYGDSMLVHMRPDEVAGLASIARAQGGSLTINPDTGLVEAFGIKSITKPFKSFADNVLGIDDSGGIAGSAAKLLKPLGPVAPIAASFIPGYGPWLAAAITGLQTGEDGKAFNFKKAATAAALAYGAQQLSNSFGSAEGMSEGVGYGDVPSTGAAGSDFSGLADAKYANIGDVGITSVDPTTLAANTTEIANAATKPSILDTITNPSTYTDLASKAVDPTTYKDLASSAIDTVTNPQTYSDLASGAWDYAKEAVSSPLEALKTASMATTAYGGVKTLQELEAQKKEAERILADQARAKAEDVAWAQSVMAQYPLNYKRITAEDVRSAAGGGIIALADGRYLQGPGDGTSDSIPARIEGGQEARLADGEYVIDARTVSELGNGSSNAGARKLRDMVNRVHAQRRKAQRGKPSSADKYLPV